MVRLGLLCVGIIMVIAGSIVTRVSAQPEEPWLSSPVMKLSEVPVSSVGSEVGGCFGSMIPILLDGASNERPACSYGSSGGLRFARYVDESATTRYSVAFSSDSYYYELRDVCTGVTACFYSQSHDTALLKQQLPSGSQETYLVDAFSRQLTKHQQGGKLYYSLAAEATKDTLATGQADIHSTALSANGKWAVVEAKGVGLARIDMSTKQLKWIRLVESGGGIQYSDALHLAISNNGQYIAQVGWQQSLEVVVVSDSCGNAGSAPQPEAQCQTRQFAVGPPFYGNSFGYSPKFTDNGKQLAFTTDSGESVRRVVISPQAYEGNFNPHYLAFGDSFTSGEGELDDVFYLPETNTATNKCHVSTRSYPYLLANAWDVLTTNHACSGSRIPDVRAKSNLILADVSLQPSLLSVGIGGNDIDLIGKLKTCLGPGTCQWSLPGNRAATVNEIKRLLPELISLIQELQRNTSSPIFLVGYPLVINPNQDATCSAMVNVLLSQQERQYVDESIRYLNKVLKTATVYTESTYVDVEDSLDGERLCDADEQSMNAVRFGDDIAPIAGFQAIKIIGAESFHPTPRGHQRVASKAEGELAGIWQSSSCSSCQVDIQPSSYWGLGATTVQLLTMQYTQRFVAADNVQGGSPISLSFPARTFDPGSSIKVELHSTPQQIATLHAAPDGSLAATVTLPYETKGYHSLHAIGESFSGEPVDIYQTLFITRGLPAIISAFEKSKEAFLGSVAVQAPGLVKSDAPVAAIPANTEVRGVQSFAGILNSQPALSIEKGSEMPIWPVIYSFIALIIGALLVIIILFLLIRRV